MLDHEIILGPRKEAVAYLERCIRAYLYKLEPTEEISTTDLVEALMPERSCRGEQITARVKTFTLLQKEWEGDLFALTPRRKGGFHKRWHYPTGRIICTCPHCHVPIYQHELEHENEPKENDNGN